MALSEITSDREIGLLRKIEALVIERDGLRTALRRIVSLDEKNVPKYAQQIAAEAL